MDDHYRASSSDISVHAGTSPLESKTISHDSQLRAKAIAVALGDLELVFQHEFSARETELYVEALSDFSPGLVELAIKRIIKTRPRFRPTPGEIREAASAELDDLERDNEHRMLAIADLRAESQRSEDDARAAKRTRWNAEHPNDRVLPKWWIDQNPPTPRNSARYTDDPMRPMSEIARLLTVNRTTDSDRLPGTDDHRVQEWLKKMDQS